MDKWKLTAIDEHMGPNQSQTNETITELWVCYSVKNTIRKTYGKHSTHHLNGLMT